MAADLINKNYIFSIDFHLIFWDQRKMSDGLPKNASAVSSIFGELISNWTEYSTVSSIVERSQYILGVLHGLMVAGQISSKESDEIWLSRICRRKDTLLALRSEGVPGQIKVLGPADIHELEAGKWGGVDFRGILKTEEASWEALQGYRDSLTLVPLKIAKLV